MSSVLCVLLALVGIYWIVVRRPRPHVRPHQIGHRVGIRHLGLLTVAAALGVQLRRLAQDALIGGATIVALLVGSVIAGRFLLKKRH